VNDLIHPIGGKWIRGQKFADGTWRIRSRKETLYCVVACVGLPRQASARVCVLRVCVWQRAGVPRLRTVLVLCVQVCWTLQLLNTAAGVMRAQGMRRHVAAIKRGNE
jgi:hypothetical protein